MLSPSMRLHYGAVAVGGPDGQCGRAGTLGLGQSARTPNERRRRDIRRRIPRIPLFLLPSQFWLPGRTGAAAQPHGMQEACHAVWCPYSS